MKRDPTIRSIATLEPAGGPRSALRALDALKALAQSSEGLSLAELSKALEIPKSSLFELMRALHHGGYVVNNRGHYQLGNGAIHLAELLAGRDRIATAARPFLLDLASTCDENAALVEIHDTQHIVYRDLVESRHPLQLRMAVGQLAPINCSSGGLAILAMRPEEQDAYVASGFAQAFTADTVHTPEALGRTFDIVKTTGIAITRNSMFEGVIAIAAPIFDADDWACASIGVIGPTARLAGHEAEIQKHVWTSAEALSRELGARIRFPGSTVQAPQED